MATSLALNCIVNSITMFERKHYFYTDLPAGYQVINEYQISRILLLNFHIIYQITQQKKPLACNGKFQFPIIDPKTNTLTYKTCRIRRIQLEHDSARSLQIDESIDSEMIEMNSNVSILKIEFFLK